MHYTGWLGPCYKWFVSCLNGLGSSGLMASSSRPRTCTPQGDSVIHTVQCTSIYKEEKAAILHQDELKNRLNCTLFFNSSW